MNLEGAAKRCFGTCGSSKYWCGAEIDVTDCKEGVNAIEIAVFVKGKLVFMR